MPKKMPKKVMTNAQAAAYFAALPPNEDVLVFHIESAGGVGWTAPLLTPGSNFEMIDEDLLDLTEEERKLNLSLPVFYSDKY